MRRIGLLLMAAGLALGAAACAPKTEQAPAAKTASSASQPRWTAAKAAQLKRYVTAWGNQQGFVYHQYTKKRNGTYYSDAADVPNAMLDDNLVALNKPTNTIAVAWATSDRATADYALVAAYCNDSNAVLGQSQLLLFTLHDGKPQVLATKQERSNDAGTTVFTVAKDAGLTDSFATIWRTGRTAVPNAAVAPVKDIHAATAILQRASVQFAPTKTPIQWNTERIVDTVGGPYRLNTTQKDGSLTVACLDGLHDVLIYRLMPQADGRVRIQAKFAKVNDTRSWAQLTGYTLALER
ncbi:DUF4767 domain-containing protein [Lacticaseibacillus kribbianus]|uniref:DUF4767 domain-containing protein n=1 Tax=Lacticaseibacillus kribbianus TaxID=2926292 RepID=UPI001CD65D9D|nr:DUF4767 domain-containing protein [Lacticaseibacillus kribbianus]